MKVAGIIAEYNPLHSGHIYQMTETRQRLGADYIVAAMSGSFTQRGIPAFFDKYLRAETALRSGADIVLELPVSVSTGSGEYFAKGAVALLNSLGVVSYLSFGSECGDLKTLKAAADFLSHETEEFRGIVQKAVSSGHSYPSAIQKAATALNPALSGTLEPPNNILGIEYLKALNELHSPIAPFTIKREGSGYNDTEIGSAFPSAAALRKYCTENSPAEMLRFLPEPVRAVFSESAGIFSGTTEREGAEDICGYLTEDDFSAILGTRLLYASSELKEYADMSHETANRLSALMGKKPVRFSELVSDLKTRQITQTRIQRALLHVMLDIRNDALLRIKTAQEAPYVRVLAMKKEAAPLMKEINRRASVPVITRPARDIKTLSDASAESFTQDLKAYELYRLAYRSKYPKSAYLPREDYKGMLLL